MQYAWAALRNREVGLLSSPSSIEKRSDGKLFLTSLPPSGDQRSVSLQDPQQFLTWLARAMIKRVSVQRSLLWAEVSVPDRGRVSSLHLWFIASGFVVLMAWPERVIGDNFFLVPPRQVRSYPAEHDRRNPGSDLLMGHDRQQRIFLPRNVAGRLLRAYFDSAGAVAAYASPFRHALWPGLSSRRRRGRMV